MYLNKINKKTKLIIILFIILVISTVYLIIYNIKSNYSIKEIEKKISARIDANAKIQYETEHDNEKYFVCTNRSGTDFVGFARFRKNMFGEYNLYQAGGTTQVYGVFQFVHYNLKLPILYIVYGHNENKEIYRFELIMKDSYRTINEYIIEEYYIKIFKFEKGNYVESINYYDKDNKLIKSKHL